MLRILDKFKKIRNNKSFFNGFIFSIFSFINRGFGFFLLMILAGFISPKEFGYLSLYNTIILFIGYFKALSTEGYLSVAFFQEGNNGIKNTISCIFSTSIIFSIFLFILIFLTSSFISNILEIPINIIYLTIPIAFFSIYFNINLDYIRIREKINLYGFLSCGNALINFLLTIVFVKYLNYGWQGRIYSEVVCSISFGLIGLIYFFKNNYIGKPDKVYWKKILIWGIPLIPHLATQFLRQGCDRFIINSYHSIEDVGIFSFALTLANIISMIGFGFNQSNSVDIYKVLGDSTLSNIKKLKKIKYQRRIILYIFISAFFLITILGYILVPIIFPKYAGATNYYLVLSIYSLGICLYLLYTNYLFYFNMTKTIMHITFFSSMLHLILSLIFTRYSLYLTCCIYCFTQLLMVILIKNKVNKIMNEKFLTNE